MTVLLLIPTLFSLLVLAAHFTRAGQPWLACLSLALGALTLVRRRWAATVLQVGLILGAVEWVRTTVAYVQVRQELGLPSGRLMLILGGVAALSALAALPYRTRTLRRRFARP